VNVSNDPVYLSVHLQGNVYDQFISTLDDPTSTGTMKDISWNQKVQTVLTNVETQLIIHLDLTAIPKEKQLQI
jgi:hypothetical protein